MLFAFVYQTAAAAIAFYHLRLHLLEARRRCYDQRMTQLEVLYRYEQHPTEATMFALGKMREVYGVRRIRMNPDWKTVQVEYDATRLNKAVVYELVRQTGLDIVEELPLIPPQPAVEAAAAPAQTK